MKKKINVAVLAGGDSAERSVSLESGRAVASALRKRGFEVRRFDPAKNLAGFIRSAKKIDVVFPALHGRGGEDGLIQGLLEFLGIPFVGSGMRGMLNSFDKISAKQIFRKNKLPVARDFVASKLDSRAAENIQKKLGLPVFVKPAIAGSSFGASIVQKKSELLPALKKAWKFGEDAVVEEFLSGVEISVGILEKLESGSTSSPQSKLLALPPIEICPKRTFFDFHAKYNPKLCEEIVPARIPSQLTREAQTLAKKAHRVLGLRHLSRTDFILQKNRIYLLETNTLPGFTKNSLYPKEARAAGIEFPELCEQLIRLALPHKK
ncbi:MAG: D-alanine--D-alanine ligase [Patescibacteria group bacterium]